MVLGKQGIVWIALFTPLLLVAVGTSYYFFKTEDLQPAYTANKQLEALGCGNTALAYYAFCAEEFQADTNYEQFRYFIKKRPALQQNRRASFHKVEQLGDVAYLEGTLTSEEKGVTPIEYVLLKQNGRWKVAQIQVRESSSDQEEEIASEPPKQRQNPPLVQGGIRDIPIVKHENPPPIDEELFQGLNRILLAIREGKRKTAYNDFMTRNFKSSISLSDFEEFIFKFPELTQFTEIKKGKETIGKSTAQAEFTLVSSRGSTPIYCTLALEMGKWKIEEIEVFATEPLQLPKVLSKKDMVTTIEMQMEKIRQRDLNFAYAQYTSEQFKETTSLASFERFVIAHKTFLENQQVQPLDLQLSETEGHLKVKLSDGGGNYAVVEYTLMYENETWKILSIHIIREEFLPTVKEYAPKGRTQIKDILIGTKVDTGKQIIEPKKQFLPDWSTLHVNIVIESGEKGAPIFLTLEHLDSGAHLDPIDARLESEGDSFVPFLFTPPINGWPPGKYQLIGKVGNAGSKIVPFEVESLP